MSYLHRYTAPDNVTKDTTYGCRAFPVSDTDLTIAGSPDPNLAPRLATVIASSEISNTQSSTRSEGPQISTTTQVVTITAKPSRQSSTFTTSTNTPTDVTAISTVGGTVAGTTASPSLETGHSTVDQGETIGLAVGLSILAALLILGGKEANRYLRVKMRAGKPKAQSPAVLWDRSSSSQPHGSGSSDTTAPSRVGRTRSAEATHREHLKTTIRHFGLQEPQPYEMQILEAERPLEGPQEYGGASSVGEGSRYVEGSGGLSTARLHSVVDIGSSGPSWVNSIPSYYTQPGRPSRP